MLWPNGKLRWAVFRWPVIRQYLTIIVTSMITINLTISVLIIILIYILIITSFTQSSSSASSSACYNQMGNSGEQSELWCEHSDRGGESRLLHHHSPYILVIIYPCHHISMSSYILVIIYPCHHISLSSWSPSFCIILNSDRGGESRHLHHHSSASSILVIIFIIIVIIIIKSSLK